MPDFINLPDAGHVAPEHQSASQAQIVALCHAITDQSPLPIIMTEGPLHTIRGSSPAFAHLVGIEPTILRGRSLGLCLAGAGAEHVMPLLDQVYSTSVPTAMSDRYHRHPVHGAVTWTYTIWPILDASSNTLGLLLEVHDMTDQQRSEHAALEAQAINGQLLIAGIREHALAEQLRLQLAFISAISGSLGEGVYALDQSGRVTYVNPTAERMLGLLEADLLGRQAGAVLHPEPVTTMPPVVKPEPFLEVLQTGKIYRDDKSYARHKDGRNFPITYTIAPIVDNGAVVGAVVVFRDLSEIRQLEATREEYLALLSHDLRTPLSAILIYAQMLLRKLGMQGSEKEASQASAIVESSRRMERMLKQVVECSAIEAGVAVLQRAPLDLVQLVGRMVAQLPTQERQRLQLQLVDQLTILGDEERLERVVVNLLTNALKYSDADAPVLVRVAVADQQALISVSDQGVGIEPEALPRLFEKHYRARSAGSVEGFGLGLYTSELIVVAHGGRISVESELGHGSTFTISLPLGAETGQADLQI